MLREIIVVPADRVGAIIGKKGRTKKKIERIADVSIRVNSSTGEVEILEKKETNPENFLKAMLVIKAIARGFDEKSALELFSDDKYLEIIDLKEFLRSKKSITRQKARIIGTDGSARKRIEELTGTKIRVYGHTVAIIGNIEGIIDAKKAVEDIAFRGKQHKTVFKQLEDKKAEKERQKLLREIGLLPNEEI